MKNGKEYDDLLRYMPADSLVWIAGDMLQILLVSTMQSLQIKPRVKSFDEICDVG
jgi:hypothetical protein